MKSVQDLKTKINPVHGGEAAVADAAAFTGDSVDTRDAAGPVEFIVHAQAGSGSASALSALFKVQTSADGSTGWTDAPNGRTATLTALNTAGIVAGDREKRYARLVSTAITSTGFTTHFTVVALLQKERA